MKKPPKSSPLTIGVTNPNVSIKHQEDEFGRAGFFVHISFQRSGTGLVKSSEIFRNAVLRQRDARRVAHTFKEQALPPSTDSSSFHPALVPPVASQYDCNTFATTTLFATTTSTALLVVVPVLASTIATTSYYCHHQYYYHWLYSWHFPVASLTHRGWDQPVESTSASTDVTITLTSTSSTNWWLRSTSTDTVHCWYKCCGSAAADVEAKRTSTPGCVFILL
jgi:hypothetical protein